MAKFKSIPYRSNYLIIEKPVPKIFSLFANCFLNLISKHYYQKFRKTGIENWVIVANQIDISISILTVFQNISNLVSNSISNQHYCTWLLYNISLEWYRRHFLVKIEYCCFWHRPLKSKSLKLKSIVSLMIDGFLISSKNISRAPTSHTKRKQWYIFWYHCQIVGSCQKMQVDILYMYGKYREYWPRRAGA